MAGVLIADGHAIFRKGLASVLDGAGWTVSGTVGDGKAALEAIGSLDPEILILDLDIPSMDGLSTLRAIRKRGDQRPVVVIAAEVPDKILPELISLKPDGIILKSSPENRLVDAIRAAQSGNRCYDSQIVDRVFTAPRDLSAVALNDRDVAICNAVAEGKRNHEIAELMGLSLATVKVYLHLIFRKLGVSKRSELAAHVMARRQLED